MTYYTPSVTALTVAARRCLYIRLSSPNAEPLDVYLNTSWVTPESSFLSTMKLPLKRAGQDRTGQVRTGHDRSGQDRTGQVRSGQIRSDAGDSKRYREMLTRKELRLTAAVVERDR
jgi:hypothetical protein